MFYFSLLPIILPTVSRVQVGWEEPSYTVNETVGRAVVCVNVTNPPLNEELVIRVEVIPSTRSFTAGEFCMF